MQKTKFALSIVSAAALLTLAACGGGGGDSAPATQQPATPTPPAPTITVNGSATAVSADPLAFVFVPVDATSNGLSARAGATATAPASLQATTAEGAYKTIAGNAASAISLTSGTIADVTGSGQFSIGRWTNGATSVGSINANQGAHYVVGRPIALNRVAGPTATLTCSLQSATLPTAVSGNFPAGKLNSATAVINLNGPLVDTLSLDISIGSDRVVKTFSGAGVTGVNLSASGTLLAETLGSDQAKPYLAIGYTVASQSSGDVSGAIVFACQ
ncbi:hypothetical protein [Cupriavidus sp. D384]|uniref:hypothetical protein n=1 Tax=Cupriavidus sp. D384 TaxID=1538095 RepID=UPI0009ED1632|nr:hypothetical protein [Cupriavidus sp. D384]